MEGAIELTKRRCVLVVEDDERMLTVITGALADEFHVFLTTSAEAAVALIDSVHHIDALLTDYNLGGRQDGLDVVRAMRAKFPFAPIVMMSGDQPELPRIVEALSVPGTSFLAKPFVAAELRSMLQGTQHL